MVENCTYFDLRYPLHLVKVTWSAFRAKSSSAMITKHDKPVSTHENTLPPFGWHRKDHRQLKCSWCVLQFKATCTHLHSSSGASYTVLVCLLFSISIWQISATSVQRKEHNNSPKDANALLHVAYEIRISFVHDMKLLIDDEEARQSVFLWGNDSLRSTLCLSQLRDFFREKYFGLCVLELFETRPCRVGWCVYWLGFLIRSLKAMLFNTHMFDVIISRKMKLAEQVQKLAAVFHVLVENFASVVPSKFEFWKGFCFHVLMACQATISV